MGKPKKKRSKRYVYDIVLPFDVFGAAGPPSADEVKAWLRCVIRLDETAPGVKRDPWYLLARRGLTVTRRKT